MSHSAVESIRSLTPFDDPYATSARLRDAFAGIRAPWPHFEVKRAGLDRVNMSNVAGYSHVPVVVP